MANLNTLTLMGKVYSIKPAKTKSDKEMVFFTIATWKRQGEGKEDKAQFHNCVAYGKLAEIIINNVEEKRNLYVEGELDYYEKEGVKHSQVIISRFEFIDSKAS
jgi:single-strand DNA-binding protein